jgi:hypothetical protein
VRKSAIVERDCRAEWALGEGLLGLSPLLDVSLMGTIQSVYVLYLLSYLPEKKHLWFRHCSAV